MTIKKAVTETETISRHLFNQLKPRFSKEKGENGTIIIDTKRIPFENVYLAIHKGFTTKNKETGQEERVLYYHYLKDGQGYDKEYINFLLSYNHHLFERLRENQPRRLFFDIDLDSERGHKNHNKYTIGDIVDACSRVVGFVCKEYEITYDDTKTQICYVEDQTKKQSLHMTFDIYFKNSYDCSQFYQYIRHVLFTSSCTELHTAREILVEENKEQKYCYMDSKVYSKSQNMRCLYQSKANKETAILVPYGKSSHEPVEHLIGLYETSKNYPFVDMRRIVENLESRNIQHLQRSTPKKKQGGEMRAYTKDEIKYDMTLQDTILRYLSCIPNGNERPQTWTLWNVIGSSLWSVSKVKGVDYFKYWVDWSNKANAHYPHEQDECKSRWDYYETYYKVNDKAEYVLRNLAIKYVGVNTLRTADTTTFYNDIYELDLTKWESKIYNSRYCQPLEFNEYDIICDKSGLGTGKTTVIQQYVSTQSPKRIVIVGCRKSFCREKYADFLKLCPDLVYYGDDKFRSSYDPSKLDKVVIEYESLHKLGMIDNLNAYDLVVLDEIEGLLDTITSDTNAQNLENNINTFEDLIKTGKKCIMADAFVSNKTLSLLDIIRRETGKKILIRVNEFKRSGKTANIMNIKKYPKDGNNPKEQMEKHILEYIKQGKKVGIITASRQYGEELEASLKKALEQLGQYPRDALRYYERFCDDLQLQADLKNVREVWSKLSVLLYTTKITVGVNYDDSIQDMTGNVITDLLNFDTIFIYGSCACPNVKNIIQAHFRIRHIKEDSIFVYLYDVPNTYVEKDATDNKRQPKKFNDYEEISKYYNERFSSVSHTFDKVQTYNEYEQDICFNDYTRIFKYYLMECGYDITDHTQKKQEDKIENPILSGTKRKAEPLTIEEIEEDEEEATHILVRLEDILTICNTPALNDELRYKIEGEKANKQDKILNEAVYMYSKYLKHSPKFSEDMEGNQYGDSKVSKMTREYINKPHLRQLLENIKVEKVNRAYDGLQQSNKCKKSRGEQNRAIMWDIVNEMCSILGMSSSLDLKPIQEDNMMKFIDHLQGKSKEQQEIIRKLFKIRVNVKKDKDNAKTLEAKSIISCILSGWNGNYLETSEKKHKKKDTQTGKMVYSRTYTYHTQEDAQEGNELLTYCRGMMIERKVKQEGYSFIEIEG